MVERRKILNQRAVNRLSHPPPNIFDADINHAVTKGTYAVARHTGGNFTVPVKDFRNVPDLPFPGETGPQFIILRGLSGGVQGIHPDGLDRRLSQHDRTVDKRVVKQKVELQGMILLRVPVYSPGLLCDG